MQTYVDPQHELGLVVGPRNPEDRRKGALRNSCV